MNTFKVFYFKKNSHDTRISSLTVQEANKTQQFVYKQRSCGKQHVILAMQSIRPQLNDLLALPLSFHSLLFWRNSNRDCLPLASTSNLCRFRISKLTRVGGNHRLQSETLTIITTMTATRIHTKGKSQQLQQQAMSISIYSHTHTYIHVYICISIYMNIEAEVLELVTTPTTRPATKVIVDETMKQQQMQVVVDGNWGLGCYYLLPIMPISSKRCYTCMQASLI